jgi:hypothetical protein
MSPKKDIDKLVVETSSEASSEQIEEISEIETAVDSTDTE